MKDLILINSESEGTNSLDQNNNNNISRNEDKENLNREHYKEDYYKVMTSDICSLDQLTKSLYFLRNVNTKRGFFNDKLEEIMVPIYELSECSPEIQKEINYLIGIDNNMYNDIFNDFLILKHIEKISLLLEKGIIKDNEEENEGTILDVNYILKDFVNSLTDKTRLRFTTPKISISKRNMTYIASKSRSIDHDIREYEEAYGLMKIIPIITIIKAKNHERGESIKREKVPKTFIWMMDKNEQILDKIT